MTDESFEQILGAILYISLSREARVSETPPELSHRGQTLPCCRARTGWLRCEGTGCEGVRGKWGVRLGGHGEVRPRHGRHLLLPGNSSSPTETLSWLHPTKLSPEPPDPHLIPTWSPPDTVGQIRGDYTFALECFKKDQHFSFSLENRILMHFCVKCDPGMFLKFVESWNLEYKACERRGVCEKFIHRSFSFNFYL